MILEMPTVFQRREALEVLPADLYNAYRGIITRIRRRPSAGQAELGMRVLMWLHFAYRPLQLVELQHALAVKKGHTEFNESNIPSPKALLECCLGLVIVDEETLTVRFMHFTLEEYFRDNARTEFPNGPSSIAENCLTYLNFGKLRQHCTTFYSLKEIMTKYAFLSYAALYWGTYVKEQSNDCLVKLAKVLLEHESERPPCAIQAMYYYLIYDKPWSIPSITAQKFSRIHVAAYFGLSENMAYFCKVEIKDDYGRTPLSWAAGEGHEAVVQLLIGRGGVDTNTKDYGGVTPLMLAARGGHEAVVRLLIERDDIDINAKDDGLGGAALMHAAMGRHEAVVRLLIERDDIDINAKNKWGNTALMLAANLGHEAVVQLLNDRYDVLGKDPDIACS